MIIVSPTYEKSASFHLKPSIQTMEILLLRKSFAIIGQSNDEIDERMNSALVLQCALFFVINCQ